jgi:NADPH:quinone reductase-like Zn-dependent oxidoreductase
MIPDAAKCRNLPETRHMLAAVLHQLGQIPRYEDFPDPVPQNADELLLHVRAASIKNIDKLRAGGSHYASYTKLPVVVGIDGVGSLGDGTRVYAQGLTGMIGQLALIRKGRYLALPSGLDDSTAAALPNAGMGAAMALLSRAELRKGETVLINGATGVTGRLAVQLAKHYGASTVIATGRNPRSLGQLTALGADEVLSLEQDDEAVVKRLKDIHRHSPIHIVIDYLWGRPAELILQSLKGSGTFTPRVRIVTVGSMAGEKISLPSGILRSSAIELLGSGIGSLSEADMEYFNGQVLPEIFQLAAAGQLQIVTETAGLKEIERVWNKEVGPGKRLVITI